MYLIFEGGWPVGKALYDWGAVLGFIASLERGRIVSVVDAEVGQTILSLGQSESVVIDDNYYCVETPTGRFKMLPLAWTALENRPVDTSNR